MSLGKAVMYIVIIGLVAYMALTFARGYFPAVDGFMSNDLEPRVTGVISFLQNNIGGTIVGAVTAASAGIAKIISVKNESTTQYNSLVQNATQMRDDLTNTLGEKDGLIQDLTSKFTSLQDQSSAMSGEFLNQSKLLSTSQQSVIDLQNEVIRLKTELSEKSIRIQELTPSNNG